MKNPSPLTTGHGARELSAVIVETYNAELRDTEGFIGDRASNRAFRSILDELRDRLRKVGEDPLGEAPTDEISKKKLDKVLGEGDPEAAGVVHGAIETFATEFTAVIARFLKLKGWRETQRIVVGGGLRASRIGELVIGRTAVLLKEAGHKIEMTPIQHHPDEAALIGAVHLAPPSFFEGFDGILAVDIGGSNMRAGLVAFNGKSGPNGKAGSRKGDCGTCTVVDLDLWRHADEAEKPTRDAAVDKLGQMLARLLRRAGDKIKVAPFVGVACPGIIAPDGQIERGGQNLPGNWESSRFNLPERLREKLPRIGDYETLVVMHNDAVAHGLSQLPFIDDVDHWGVFTIGTGLGNAAFTNRASAGKPKP